MERVLIVYKTLERNASIELLRIFSMVGIVIFHFVSQAYCAEYELNFVPKDSDMMWKLLFRAMGQTAVPIFMFISGYYGMKCKMNRVMDMLIQCLLYYGVFWFIAKLLLRMDVGGVRVAVLSLFGVSNLWFMYGYMVIYLLSDGINQTIDKLNFRQYAILVSFLMYVSIGLWIIKASALNMFILLEIYIVARFIKKYMNDKWKNRMAWFILPSAIIFLLPVFYGWNQGSVSSVMPYVNKYYNPFILLFAMTLVVSADKCNMSLIPVPCRKTINWFASSVLATYLITSSSYFSPYGYELFHPEEFNVVWILFVASSIVLVCCLIDKLRIYVTKLIKKCVY